MKEQASSITIAKVEELCRLIPALNNELNLERGQTRKTKEDVEYVFKNGSKINILAAKQSSRGQRRVGGVIEECVLVDGEVLNEVIIPTTNIDRLLADGTRVPDEMVNKSQVYIKFLLKSYIFLVIMFNFYYNKDYSYKYNNMTEEEKQNIVSQLRNKLM